MSHCGNGGIKDKDSMSEDQPQQKDKDTMEEKET